MDDPWAEPVGKEEKSVGGNVSNEHLSFFEKIVNVLFHPGEFFEWVKNEDSSRGAIKQVLLLNYILASLIFIIGLILITFAKTVISLVPGLESTSPVVFVIGLSVFAALFPLLSLLGYFIQALIYHLVVLIFGGRGFHKTFNLVVYSATPILVLPITIIGVVLLPISGLWNSFLVYYGLVRVHEFSFVKGLIVFLISIIVFALIFVGLFAGLGVILGFNQLCQTVGVGC